MRELSPGPHQDATKHRHGGPVTADAAVRPDEDDLVLLTGEPAGDLLAVALGTEGGQLLDWRARAVDTRPGAGTTVSYRATASYAGTERVVWLGASTRPLPAGADTSRLLVLGDGRRTVAVWAWPHDPWLPALAAACDAGAVEDLLASFGAPRSPVRLRVHAYRPGRRAVLEGRSSTGRMFVKVLRPDRVRALHDRHQLLAGAGLPVPRSLGWSQDGLLALSALRGTSARTALRTGHPLPAPEDLVALLDRLPPAVQDLPRRPAWTDGARHYAGVVGSALHAGGRPDDAARAVALAERLEAALAGAGEELEPVHGDLYEAQLLLGPDGAVTGLLDVDSAGPGRRADDLGCLLAHLEVLGQLDGWPAAALRRTAAHWSRVFAARVDPRELALRTAGVLLSLATGPHRVQETGWPDATCRRLDAAERWAEGAVPI
jgi:hypothetical protein